VVRMGSFWPKATNHLGGLVEGLGLGGLGLGLGGLPTWVAAIADTELAAVPQ
jgi:hypothetical protein